MLVAVSEYLSLSIEIVMGSIQGETIETFFGAAFCLSTMAGRLNKKEQESGFLMRFDLAAALGNAVSDVMGIG